ncbi:MAG: hypothetical protein JXB50_07505 [Spirochaetes bacterium]|nr:hypothetical protein [Spirochaetota bacterium]
MNNKYSIWLMPEKITFKYFYTIIKNISKEYKSLVFPPHITILGNIIPSDFKQIEKQSILFTENIQSIRINVDKPEIGNNYFKALYLKIKKNNELLQLYQTAKKYFIHKDSNFYPHLSLYYGYLNKRLKKEIIIKYDFLKIKNFICNQIYIYQTAGKVLNWKLIYNYSLK